MTTTRTAFIRSLTVNAFQLEAGIIELLVEAGASVEVSVTRSGFLGWTVTRLVTFSNPRHSVVVDDVLRSMASQLKML